METLGKTLSLVVVLAVVLGMVSCGKSPTEMVAEKAKETVTNTVTEAVGNKVMEKAIESAASKDGQKVDVDLKNNAMTVTGKDGEKFEMKSGEDGGSMSVTSDDGTTEITTGTGAKIPEGFPKDVPVYAGAEILMGGGNVQQGNFNVQLESADSMENVAAYYKKELAAQGWTEQSTMSQAGDQPVQMLQYAKGEMGVVVMIMLEDGKTMINLSCMKQ